MSDYSKNKKKVKAFDAKHKAAKKALKRKPAAVKPKKPSKKKGRVVPKLAKSTLDKARKAGSTKVTTRIPKKK